MSGTGDSELLGFLDTERRDEAFGLLVNRYTNLVYASAIRQLNDWTAAQDVTQAVFIVLLKKSRTVRSGAALPAWLLSVTRLACLDVIKRKNRREFHEHEASRMPSTNPTKAFDTLTSHLDDALAVLPMVDRTAVALRYLASQSFAEVGEALGISADAAKKRVTRALARMRRHLARKGLIGPADALEGAMANLPTTIAPPSLTASIHAACHGQPSGAVSAISRGVQWATVASSTKAAVLIGVAAATLLIAGTAVSLKLLQESARPANNPVAVAVATTRPTTKSDDIANSCVSIQGEVRYPGLYTIENNPMNALQLVMMGKLDKDIDLTTARVLVIRPTGPKTAIKVCYSLQDILTCKIEPPLLKARDAVCLLAQLPANITFDRSDALPADTGFKKKANFYVGGIVTHPGLYWIKRPGTTIRPVLLGAGVPGSGEEAMKYVVIFIRAGQPSTRTTYSYEDILLKKIRPLPQGGDIFLLTKPE